MEYLRNKWQSATIFAKSIFCLLIMLCIGTITLMSVLAVDTDKDGMTDEYETFFSLNADNPSDGPLSYDEDALSNVTESVFFTDPYIEDTDRDGFIDGEDSNAVSRAYIDWGEPLWTKGDNYIYIAPDWFEEAFKIGGEWLVESNSTAWHVSQAEDANSGQLCIKVDRNILTNNLVLQLELLDTPDATLYVDLVDTNEDMVLANLFGNVLGGSNENERVELNIPLADNPDASCIVLYRGTGEITIYESQLYIDEDGDGLDADQELQLGTSDRINNNGASAGGIGVGLSRLTGSPANNLIKKTGGEAGNVIHVNFRTGKDKYNGRSEAVLESNDQGPKKTINAGLSIAKPGDTIKIWPGQYDEEVNLCGKEKELKIEIVEPVWIR